MSPVDVDPSLLAAGFRSNSPVVYNPSRPIMIGDVNDYAAAIYDLNNLTASAQAKSYGEKVLILTPLKDAVPYLAKYFELISQITYPHELIDIGFLVSDSSDETKAVLALEIKRIQQSSKRFRNFITIYKDFGVIGQTEDVEERHAYEFQGVRRKAMAKARNFLLYSTLLHDHSWVLWRDVDVVESPATIIEDLTSHDTDIVVPNIWFHRYHNGKDIEGRYDYNAWIESETALELQKHLDRDFIIAEGYPDKIKTDRTYMCRMGDWRADQSEEIELDGVGGVIIMVKADLHRAGINFPSYAFENQAETEGFAKMAKRAGYRVVGLPNYVVWHIDTEERPK
ncbi:glycosyltransferase family 62 protein [Tortispora caseinolytica NRRL Y-17796]|uniref:Glycosyltransferase family 62 protein n=1 Tax=Tortispora caseinolytica NRRL Y-17796 TaxID=767744 RepID=A0A1E4TD22_9ASCO|nr:glycosyltransferase family 62 protein [Tortispora caseinolytica NRRL Y-17796]